MKKTNDHKKFLDSLNKSEQMLVGHRDELYEGNWNNMKTDLEDRLVSKPYIFKLVKRIEEDLDGIKKLQVYEEKNKINLKDFV